MYGYYILFNLFITLVILLIVYVKNVYSYWRRRGIPHERPTPPLGNLKGLGRTFHFRDMSLRYYKQFKGSAPYAGMYFFFWKVALVLDLELVKQILTSNANQFQNRGVYHNVRDDPLTGHLVALEGKQWRAMRNKLTPVFTSSKMKFMFPTIVTVSEHFADACQTMMQLDSDQNVDIKDLSARYTTDVIGTCAFGIECNSLQDPNAEFRHRGRSIFEKPRHTPLILSLLNRNMNLARLLHIKVIRSDVSKFFLEVVKSTVQFRIKNNVKRNDFMDLLIALKASDEEAGKSRDGIDLSHGLTIEQMAAQAFVFFGAGFDTSSTTMACCLHELALQTPIQDKARDEIFSVLSKHNNELTYEAMNDMHYLEQIIMETLRKHPVLPNLIRKTTTHFQAGSNRSHCLEEGITVIVPVHAIHHDPEFYPEPDLFDPERFTQEAIKERPQMSYLPFGAGPRNCIGLRFGKMQAKIGLITLLRRFKFTTSSRTENPIEICNRNFMIRPKNGVYLRVDPI
ncbi:probable cytochrome P450 6a14 [Teleopsis dalmanni]|uniref:probable cytochrome P450 6a14 n=1 Tax=Teleopsis dalmanni TaxID=139649 RepID=UPI0018CF6025|nr:probable cytochrome P450 6a14 [Teleopsis dalmanni]